jgi:rhamnogalacturonan endolyase
MNYSVKLWQIGIANRVNSKDEFKFCNYPRQYGLWRSFPEYGLTESPPADLTFIIGSSIESQNWYYCQTKKGSWNIQFDVNEVYSGHCVLTLGLAGTSRYPELSVFLNSQLIKNYKFGQAQGPYRSAILGNFYEKHELRFPASELQVGTNRLRLMLTSVRDGGGIYYDVIKLEVDEPNAINNKKTTIN